MNFFAKFFNKKNKSYTIDKQQEKFLVIMVPIAKSIKLNTKIQVPDNFCAVLFSKEKLLDVIPSGEFELTGLTIPKVCKANKLDKPTKKGYKKIFNADFYFVNKSSRTLKNSFYIKKINQTIAFTINSSILAPISFLKFLIDEKVSFDNMFAEEELTFYVSQLVYYFLLDNKVYTKEKINQYLEKKLSAIGVKFDNLQINFNDKNVEEIITPNTELKMLNENDTISNNKINDNDISKNNTYDFNLKDNKQTYIRGTGIIEDNSIDQTSRSSNYKKETTFLPKSSLVDLEDITEEKISYFTCDSCGAKLPTSATHCFKCKKSFIEKHICENCGQIIPENIYVCPYCNSVIIS